MKCLLLVLLLVPVCGMAEIYTWTDAAGTVHFGDSPADRRNAERVEVEINSYAHVEIEIPDRPRSRPAEAASRRVTMYATSWCGYCAKARSYFAQRGIDYVEYDIEKNAGAKREYDRLGGNGVPVILVGNARLNGFSPAGFERIYR